MTNFLDTCGVALAAILNTLWQTAAVTLAAWAALRFLPRIHVWFRMRINPATQCAVWWGVLAAIVILPMVPQPTPAPVSAFVSVQPDSSASVAPAVVWSAADIAPAPTPNPWPLKLPRGSWFLLVVATWSLLSLYRMVQLARSYHYLNGIKRRGRAVSPEQSGHFERRLRACNIRRAAQLLASDEIISPMAIGFLRPAVIVPGTLRNEFSAQELDHVFLHELAHIARHDDWTNLFARLIGALLPFHPVAVWVLKRIEQDREIACDDWVVAMTGDARPYAASLTRLFELCAARRRQLLATGMADRASHLGERIEALLRSGREFAPRVSLTGLALGSVVLLGLVFAGAQAPHWVAFAQDPPVAPQPPVVSLPPLPSLPAVVPMPPMPPIPDVPPLQGVAPLPTVAPELPSLLTGQQRDLERSLSELRRLLQEQSRVYTEGHPQIRALQAQIRETERRIPDQARMQQAQNRIKEAELQMRVGEERMRAAEKAMQAQLGALAAGDREAQRAQQRTQGTSGSFLAALVAAGYGGLSVDEIIELRNHGVSTGFLQSLGPAGPDKIPTKDLIAMADSGVRPEFFKAMRQAFPQITTREIVETAQSGLRADDLRRAKEYSPNLTLPQLIRLKQAGVI